MPADDQTTHHYAAVFRQLWKQGTPIPTNDMWLLGAPIRLSARGLSVEGALISSIVLITRREGTAEPSFALILALIRLGMAIAARIRMTITRAGLDWTRWTV